MGSMTRFKHKATGIEFLFFNSHWKHGYGSDQKKIIANAIHEERQKYAVPPPTILVGDTNQFCMAAELEALKYLKGEEGNSPVTFTDAIGHDKGSSYDGGCRIDFILRLWRLKMLHPHTQCGCGSPGAFCDF